MIDKYSMLPIVGAKMTDAEKFHISEEERREAIKSARNTGLQQAAEAQAIRAEQTNEMRRKWAIEQTVQLLHRKTHYEQEFFTMVDKIQKYLVSGELPHTGT